jgi:hypothetical protein
VRVTHSFLLDEPERYQAELREFLRRLDAVAGLARGDEVLLHFGATRLDLPTREWLSELRSYDVGSDVQRVRWVAIKEG